MRLATATFFSTVLAMPSSSMVSATTAAPCSRASGSTRSAFPRPISRLIELMTARPGYVSSAACITFGSVVSITSGASMPISSFFTARRICSSSSPRSVRATCTSSTCAPPAT